jgi:ADP-ribose pyrophosphatase YjhB (NUDIX family)
VSGAAPGIRPVALAVIRRGAALLVYEGSDEADGRRFYRPLGGGVHFGERSEDAVRRELREELGAELREPRLLGVLEEVFRFRGVPCHELVFAYEASFDDAAWYDRAVIDVDDEGDALRAVWVSPRTLDRALYPEGLLDLLPPPAALKARGIVRTPTGSIVLLRRQRPGEEPYWTLPGGRVETRDATARDALVRELREELGAEARVGALVDDLDDGHEDDRGRRVRTLVYEASIERWSAEERAMPELAKPWKGTYAIEEHAPDPTALGALPFRPQQHADLFRKLLDVD